MLTYLNNPSHVGHAMVRYIMWQQLCTCMYLYLYSVFLQILANRINLLRTLANVLIREKKKKPSMWEKGFCRIMSQWLDIKVRRDPTWRRGL